MFDKTALQIALLKAGKTMSDLADALGISLPTLYRKVSGKGEFTRLEIQKTCDFLNLDTPIPVFFAS